MNKYPKSDKVAVVPVDGTWWGNITPQEQMSYMVAECARFMGTPYFQNFGGFRIMVMRADGAELVLVVGADPIDEKLPAIITPGLIMPGTKQ